MSKPPAEPEYEVGYGKPPMQTRFKKGVGGGGRGRPKGSRNFGTDLREELNAPVLVREGERTTRVPSQRASLKKLRQQALTGDQRSLEKFIALAERHAADEAAKDAEIELAEADLEILGRWRERERAELIEELKTQGYYQPSTEDTTSSDEIENFLPKGDTE
jgi:hypothetical protein